jgi:hypothetical protein
MPMSFTEIQVAEQLRAQRTRMNQPAQRMAELAREQSVYAAQRAADVARMAAKQAAAAQPPPVAAPAPQWAPGEYEAAIQAAQRAQMDTVRQSAAEQGMTPGETEAYIQMAQRAGQEEEKTMAGMLDPQALAIANAVSDVALRLLRDEAREFGLAGLGQFDFSALIAPLINAASSIATTKIKQQTEIKLGQQQAALQQAQAVQEQRLLQQQAALQAQIDEANSVLPAGFTSTLAQPTVWVPVALAGGALVLFLMLRK